MKYQKYPAQMIKVAGDLRRAPATFENPAGFTENKFYVSVPTMKCWLKDTF